MSTPPREPFQISGRAILAEVRDAYTAAYRQRNLTAELAAVIVRFEASPSADETWAARMEASRVSAEQKRRTFTALGVDARLVTLPDTAERARLAEVIERANRDEHTVAVIVQSPPPPRLSSLLNTIDPAKDIDALGLHTTAPRCATADGIVRVADPFLDPDTTIAVVGAHGFVGRGVVSGLRERGHDPVLLDLGDDLHALRDVDVVLSATGQPGLITAAHLGAGQRLVVDSGFMPTPAGPRGDLAPQARTLPAAITPVPGGIGPVEMAVLAERLTQTHAAPDLAAWTYHGPAPRGTSLTSAARDVTQQLRHTAGPHPEHGPPPQTRAQLVHDPAPSPGEHPGRGDALEQRGPSPMPHPPGPGTEPGQTPEPGPGAPGPGTPGPDTPGPDAPGRPDQAATPEEPPLATGGDGSAELRRVARDTRASRPTKQATPTPEPGAARRVTAEFDRDATLDDELATHRRGHQPQHGAHLHRGPSPERGPELG